jgi:tetratricopeptide (TPR) repeat protein
MAQQGHDGAVSPLHGGADRGCPRGRLSLAAVVLAAGLAVGVALAQPAAAADSASDCFSEDNERRITGCTEILSSPSISEEERSTALAMRALAYSLKGQYDRAIQDYDAAITINPNFAVALNNRAWAYYKSGRGMRGLPDAERSLALSPLSAHTYDTRAHIRQEHGDTSGALNDYELAMRYGGPRMVKLYQCGLQAHGLFRGRVDGLYSRELREAMVSCVKSTTCDPLPADEECRAATS